MGKGFIIFLNGIANSLNPNGYNNIVSSTKKLGESTSKINTKRKINQDKINKVVDVRITEATA